MPEEEKIQKQTLPPLQRRIINIESVYMNTFDVNLSFTDIFVTMMLNGSPFQSVNMSLTTAKSLSQNLARAIKDYEEKTGVKVLSMEEAREALKK